MCKVTAADGKHALRYFIATEKGWPVGLIYADHNEDCS